MRKSGLLLPSGILPRLGKWMCGNLGEEGRADVVSRKTTRYDKVMRLMQNGCMQAD
jgi:hypothetical protein